MEIQICVAMILNKNLGGFKSPSSNKHVSVDSFRVKHHDNFEWNHYPAESGEPHLHLQLLILWLRLRCCLSGNVVDCIYSLIVSLHHFRSVQ